jgi:hypothetical protein
MGSIPTHGPCCQTWHYSTKCWHCGKAIYVLQCTCGSAVLFESLGWPWPEHECRGIGGSGLSGWIAVDILRANAVPIDSGIMQKAFPPPELQNRKPNRPLPSEQTKAVLPTAGKRVTLLGVVRDMFTTTKRTKHLENLGSLGAKFLRLPKGPLRQVTFVVNSERPNLTYTCIVPARLGLPRDAKNKMVLASLEARVVGEHAMWIATDARLV